MSFGYSVGDFIAIGQLTWLVYPFAGRSYIFRLQASPPNILGLKAHGPLKQLEGASSATYHCVLKAPVGIYIIIKRSIVRSVQAFFSCNVNMREPPV
jgi:hypothetical protein